MIVWTSAVLGVLYACVLCFCICTCSTQNMFHMERRSRNTLIISSSSTSSSSYYYNIKYLRYELAITSN